jgi:hypothetical protein
MLKTEQNTDRMWRRVIKAAKAKLPGGNSLRANFEHGQFWIADLRTGAQWSVVDAEGYGAVDGFDFEQVSQGEED